MPLPVYPAFPAAPQRFVDTDDVYATKADPFAAAIAQIPANMAAYALGLLDQVSTANYSATSVTNLTIGTGAKSLVIQTGKLIVGGQFLLIADAAAPATNSMFAQVTAYNAATGALDVTVLRVWGAGTKAAWVIGLSGPQGIGGDVLPAFAGNYGRVLAVNAVETAAEWVVAESYIRQSATYVLTSTTATQKLFNGSINGAITLPDGVYQFSALVTLQAMSATSGNAGFSLLGAGSAKLANVLFHMSGQEAGASAAGISAADGAGFVNVPSATLYMATDGTGTVLSTYLTGQFVVTGAGTLIPSIALKTAAAAQVLAGSHFALRRLGAGDTNGAWS